MASTISELATLSDLTGTIYLPAIKLVGSSYSNYKIDFSSFVTPSDLSDYVAHSDFSANGILKRTALGTYTSITDNSSNWDTAYSWGDHSGQGYLTSAVTSVAATVPTGFTVSGSPITTTGTLAIAYDTGYQGYTTTEATKLAGIATGAQVNTVDSVNTQTGAVVLDADDIDDTATTHKFVAAADISNWNTAFGWGNHASAGYLDASDIGVSVQAYDANLPTWPVGVDATEVGYLNGVTSSIQTQLNGKITAFADPNADRIVFWDDSAGAFAALTASTGLTISGTSMTVRSASATQTGIVELATDAETTTGTDTTRAITPANLTSQIGTRLQAYSSVLENTTASFTTADETKLDGIETAADVTDATNVAAAGAVMDGDFVSNGLMARTGAGTYSVVTDNSTNWDTAYGWGDHSVEGYLTGIADEAITEAKLDSVNTPTDGYVLSYVSASGRMQWIAVAGTGTVTSVAATVPTGFTISGSPITSSGTLTIAYDTGYQGYTTAEASKLSGIETSADVTDATNVAAAGAVMDGDFVSNGLMSRTGAGTYTVVTDNSSNWNTAFGWGNHASAGYITSSGVTYENLDANGDIGTGSTQVAAGNHTHSGVYEPVDADILRADTDDNLTAGYTSTADNDGTKSSGTYTPDPAGGNLKYITANGAFTLAAPTASGDYTIIIQITNGASAGTITFSGFAASGPDGDAYTTTNGDDFMLFITKINGFVLGTLKALQ